MCGIVGLVTRNKNSENTEALKSASKFIDHRGPDQSALFENKNIVFIHKRLSIVDLKRGNQPIINGNFVLIANGEIYNDLLIRKECKKFNYTTGSDCESILAVYSTYGLEGFKKLRGMFAFAIYDLKNNNLILGRDPFGIKPLYFYSGHENLIFSSEPQVLIKSKLVKKDLNKKKFKELLQIQFSSANDTIFKKISRLRPGEILISKYSKIVESSIYSTNKLTNGCNISDEKKLENVLTDSVTVHQRSDVPYGLFFSGGIDSTLILYLMSISSSKSVDCFTILFPGDEEKKKKVSFLAKKFNSKVKFVEFDSKDFWSYLPKTIEFLDDPIADYATVPTFRLAEVASKNVKVVLTGEGGDEMFGGYGRYRSELRTVMRKIFLQKGTFDKFGNPNDFFNGWNFDLSFCRESINNLDLSKIQKSQLFDFNEWLPNNLLIKLDRCLMAHSLEGRTPLIDIEVFKNFFNIDDNEKINKGNGKLILKKFLKKKISTYNPFEKKQGFTVPIGDWIPNKSRELFEVLSRSKILNEFFRSSDIKKLCSNCNNKKNASMLWRLLFFSIWYLIHIENVKVEGNAFEMLHNNQ